MEAVADYLNKAISDVDKNVTGSIGAEIQNKIKTIQKEQHDRNRRVVKEIIDTCKLFQTEIEDEVAQLKGDNEDGD